MSEAEWIDVGDAGELRARGLCEVKLGRTPVAVSCVDGRFGAVSSVCNHVGGPLGQGTLAGDYVVCPWHNWKFHRVTGEGEPGYEADRVPSYEVREENSRLLVRRTPSTTRNKTPHAAHPLARKVVREGGPVRVLGISTTAMDESHPRYSTSDALLDEALRHAREGLGAEARLVRLSGLSFRHCEGYYSKAARACTWPCSITQMDKRDQMEQVYEGIVHWADVVLVATPIRWGAASSLYFKMVERMNCVQNAITIRDEVLIRDKSAAFIITGGQDNIQAVAGQMLGFFAEIGCVFPPFPYVAHSRGWSAEDMENNVAYVRRSEELRQGVRELVERSVALADKLLAQSLCGARMSRAGRKAHHMEE